MKPDNIIWGKFSQEDLNEFIPAWKRPPLSERHLYWIILAVQSAIILGQWGLV